jgi:hypothetical protein
VLSLQVTSHSGEHMDPELLNMERTLLAGAGGGDPEVGEAGGMGGWAAHTQPIAGLCLRGCDTVTQGDAIYL